MKTLGTLNGRTSGRAVSRVSREGLVRTTSRALSRGCALPPSATTATYRSSRRRRPPLTRARIRTRVASVFGSRCSLARPAIPYHFLGKTFPSEDPAPTNDTRRAAMVFSPDPDVLAATRNLMTQRRFLRENSGTRVDQVHASDDSRVGASTAGSNPGTGASNRERGHVNRTLAGPSSSISATPGGNTFIDPSSNPSADHPSENAVVIAVPDRSVGDSRRRRAVPPPRIALAAATAAFDRTPLSSSTPSPPSSSPSSPSASSRAPSRFPSRARATRMRANDGGR